MNPFTIVTGLASDYVVQTWLRGSITPAAYALGDVLVCNCYRSGTTTALFQPAVTFYTKNGNQTGYTEGQLLISLSNAQASLLVPGIRYGLEVTWSPLLNLTKVAAIVRIPLVVLPRAYP
jgi:hypothetical protein